MRAVTFDVSVPRYLLARTLGRVTEADEADRRALELTSNLAERNLLLNRLR